METQKEKASESVELSKDFRIEKLEVSKEETENEIKQIEITIQEVIQIADLKPLGTAREELNRFIGRLEQQKVINEEIKDEIIESIQFVRGY